jgi:hypothetical protein
MREVVCEKLDCNGMPSRYIIAEVNGTHPAFANSAEQPITSDLTKVGVGSVGACGVGPWHLVPSNPSDSFR